MKKLISGTFCIFLITVLVSCSRSYHLELIKAKNASKGVPVTAHTGKNALPLLPEFHPMSHQLAVNEQQKIIADSFLKLIPHYENRFPESISFGKKITPSKFPEDDQPKEKRKYNRAAVNSFFLSLGSIVVFYILLIIILVALGVNGPAAFIIFSALPAALMDIDAIRLGIKGYRQIVANKEKGRFFAIVGIALGAILLAFFLYFIILFGIEWLRF